jgi:spore maturation protein CgeB
VQLLRYVHEHPDEAAAVGARARQEVLRSYSLEAMGHRVLAELRRIQDNVLSGHSATTVDEL